MNKNPKFEFERRDYDENGQPVRTPYYETLENNSPTGDWRDLATPPPPAPPPPLPVPRVAQKESNLEPSPFTKGFVLGLLLFPILAGLTVKVVILLDNNINIYFS